MKLWPRNWHPFLFILSALFFFLVIALIIILPMFRADLLNAANYFTAPSQVVYSSNKPLNIRVIEQRYASRNTTGTVLLGGDVLTTPKDISFVPESGGSDQNESSGLPLDVSDHHDNPLPLTPKLRDPVKYSSHSKHVMVVHPFPAIVYPLEARRDGQQGRVLLKVTLNADTSVKTASISKSSGYPLLDQAAVKGVTHWKIDPPEDSMRVIYLPVTFQLNQTFAENQNFSA